ncbi:MAG: hypothetical protein MN733_24220 [Nitrososphaera sp.]|nr:hypothetical protein [Nitrososphaera sp.]
MHILTEEEIAAMLYFQLDDGTLGEIREGYVVVKRSTIPATGFLLRLNAPLQAWYGDGEEPA